MKARKKIKKARRVEKRVSLTLTRARLDLAVLQTVCLAWQLWDVLKR